MFPLELILQNFGIFLFEKRRNYIKIRLFNVYFSAVALKWIIHQEINLLLQVFNEHWRCEYFFLRGEELRFFVWINLKSLLVWFCLSFSWFLRWDVFDRTLWCLQIWLGLFSVGTFLEKRNVIYWNFLWKWIFIEILRKSRRWRLSTRKNFDSFDRLPG